jgi:hypothetical protein
MGGSYLHVSSDHWIFEVLFLPLPLAQVRNPSAARDLLFFPLCCLNIFPFASLDLLWMLIIYMMCYEPANLETPLPWMTKTFRNRGRLPGPLPQLSIHEESVSLAVVFDILS